MHLAANVATILLASGILSSSSQQRALHFAMATHHEVSLSEHSINTPYNDAPSSLRRRRGPVRRRRILQELHTMKNKHEEHSISHSDEQRRKLHAVGVIHEHDDDEQGTTTTNNNVDERWDDYQPFTSTSDVTNFLQSTAMKISEQNQDQEEDVVIRPEYINITDTSLFDTNQIINNPLQSNRNEILTNTSQQQKPKSQMIPTMSPAPSSPTISPVPTPSTPSTEPGIIIHDGPHFSDEDTYNYNDNDDPPSGHGYYGSRDENGNYIREETDFKEFIAFVGWYAFLIICCLLPTFCAYYRRRRNARALRENLTNIQTRLAEIERRRNENDTTTHLELEGENRDRDWEYLESLFGSSSPSNTTNTNNSEEEEESRRRIMSDIMGSVGIRVLDLMERDVRRRKEKGRKVVGALKQTSLLVKECHLVDNSMKNKKKEEGETTAHDNNGDDNIVLATGELNDSIVVEEGDIELGNMNCNRSSNEDKPVNGLKRESEDEGIPQESEHNDLTSNMVNDVLTSTADLKKQTTSIEDSDKTDGSDNVMPTPSAPLLPPLTTKSETNKNNDDSQAITTTAVDDDTTAIAAPQSVDAAILAITPSPSPPRDNPMSSLYQVDDPYVDDDDDEGNAVLCIPCANNNISDESSKTIVTITQPRCVPATCIICLLQYEPGTYVTWSSNKECTHAFHRDCILMWLLKKDEPYLCPCCRREFVLESMLNNDDNNEEERGGGGGTDSSGGGADVIVLEHNLRQSVQQRDDNGQLADTTVATPAWNSLSNAARPL